MITIIAAVSQDGFIGKNGKIPWHLRSDMEHFKKVTTGHTVIMGRKTWDSIPTKFRPLLNRRNIVLTRQDRFVAVGAEVVDSLEAALTISAADAEVFVIGGLEVYRQALPLAERLLITQVLMDVVDGDAKFPIDFPFDDWNLAGETAVSQNQGDACQFKVQEYYPELDNISLAGVRTKSQLQIMRAIRKSGRCPFCQENLFLYHNKPIILEGDYWLLTENQWPYPGKNVHLLLISRLHCERICDLGPAAHAEFFSIVRQLELDGTFPSGAICMRSGIDTMLSGASVKHLHCQIISPQKGSVVKFHIGITNRAIP